MRSLSHHKISKSLTYRWLYFWKDIFERPR